MKTIILALVLISSFSLQGIDEIREQFQKASLNKENATAFNELVKKNTSINNNLHTAFLGASETVLSKFESTAGAKVRLFKSGVAQIENAVEADPNSVEIRLIRLMVQKNAPPVVKYSKNIEADKQFILENLKSSSPDVKHFVMKVSKDTGVFTTEELNQLN